MTREQLKTALRWAIVGGDKKCVGKWMPNSNGILVAHFIIPKRYCSEKMQAEMTLEHYPYVEFYADDDEIAWGSELSRDMLDAFIYEGLPHKSEWVK